MICFACLLNLQHVGPKQHAYLQGFYELLREVKSSTSSSFEFLFIYLSAQWPQYLCSCCSGQIQKARCPRVWELFTWEHEREVKGFSSKPKPVVLLLLLGNVDVDGGYEYCLFPPWAMYWIQCVALPSEGLCEKIPMLFHEGLFK